MVQFIQVSVSYYLLFFSLTFLLKQPGLGEVKVLGNPIKLSETPAVPRGPAPSLGQHTQQILFEVLGLTPEDVLALHKKS